MEFHFVQFCWEMSLSIVEENVVKISSGTTSSRTAAAAVLTEAGTKA